MSRYSGGWGYWGHRRPSPVSPYASIGSETMPAITDDDFAYITSEDIINHSVPSLPHAVSTGRRAHARARSRPRVDSPPPEDDVLIIKNKGVTYPAHFDAYSIFDGNVTVRDVQEKIGEMMELSDRATRDVKLLYKGKNLSEIDAPVKQYGVKNNSEILAVVRDMPRHRDSRDDGSIVSSTSSEDVVVVTDSEPNSNRKKKKKSKRRLSQHIHRDSNASNLSLPNFVTDRMENTSPSPPTVPSLTPSPSPAPAVPGGPIEKLDNILSQFEAELVPMCNEFMAYPPTDAKKLEDEHRKLTETIFQRVLLKLDEVDTGGNDDARARRRQLVKHTQDVLNMLDASKAAAIKSEA